MTIANNAEFQDLAGDLYRAGAYNESIEKPLNALIKWFDAELTAAQGGRVRAECVTCGGFGEVVNANPNPNGRSGEHREDCDDCNGTGIATNPQPLAVGGKP